MYESRTDDEQASVDLLATGSKGVILSPMNELVAQTKEGQSQIEHLYSPEK